MTKMVRLLSVLVISAVFVVGFGRQALFAQNTTDPNAAPAGNASGEFDTPSDVISAPNGDIFVADGHGVLQGHQTNDRIKGRDIHHGVGKTRLRARGI